MCLSKGLWSPVWIGTFLNTLLRAGGSRPFTVGVWALEREGVGDVMEVEINLIIKSEVVMR